MMAIETLDIMPTRFAVLPQSRKYGVELREMVLGKRRSAIRVFFQIERDLVYIVHIRRGSRGPLRVTDFEFLER
jgi:hypothetical protein